MVQLTIYGLLCYMVISNLGGLVMVEKTPIQTRLFDNSLDIESDPSGKPVFQHAIFCQTCLPYRKPDPSTRHWERSNGNSKLIVSAGDMYNPKTGKLEPVGLPYGPKARLIQSFFDTEAVKSQSQVINVESSLSAFVRRIDLAKNGRNIKTVREQLQRLTVCRMHIILNKDDYLFQQDQKVVKNFSFWQHTDIDKDKQKELFESTSFEKVTLDSDYFNHLLLHAVPLDERALKSLSHNCLALDIYKWLAHRLHRVSDSRGQLVPWVCIKEQFGHGYTGAMSQFRRNFTPTLKTVLTQYPAAKLEVTGGGLKLFNSRPPISKTLISVPDLPYHAE